MVTLSGCKDVVTRKFELVAKTQTLCPQALIFHYIHMDKVNMSYV